MVRWTAVLFTSLSVVVPAAAAVYRFGPLGDSLPPEDIAAIEALVVEQGVPWALSSWGSQVLPDTTYVDVFLQPTVTRSTLRRGRVLRLQYMPSGDQLACLRWTPAGDAGTYVQVADGPRFIGDLGPRSPLERPIRTAGEFSDEEILTLVSYIRGSPRPQAPRDVSLGRINGSVPIRDIRREVDGSARAWLTHNGGIVQSGRFVRTRRGWRITEVVHGIA